MIRTMLLSVGALLASTGAQAQYAPHSDDGYRDASYQAGEPRVPYRDVPLDDHVFGGLRVEARLSYDRLKLDTDSDEVVVRRRRRTGLGYGAEVGYDLPLGGIVLGAYAGAEGSTVRECLGLDGGDTLCTRLGRTFTAGGRVGFAASPSLLLYAKGGYSNTQVRLRAVTPDALPPFDDLRIRDKLDGYHIGGGVEAALSRRTYGKLEYVYTRLDGSGGDDDLGLDYDRHQVQAGIGVRF